MSKTKLDDRSTEWGIVINPTEENPVGFSLRAYFKKLKGIYPYIAMIMHDSDINEKGEKETIHMQVALKTPRKRKETLLNELSEILEIPKEVISIDKAINWRKANRYLIHLDDEDKYHYPPFDVLTTDEKYYQSFLIDRLNVVSEEELIEIVRKEIITSKILLKIGSDNYKKYALIIRDLQKELTQ